MPPPRFDQTPKEIYLRVNGGILVHPCIFAPKFGPLGLSPQKMTIEIAEATKEWKGMKVLCKFTVMACRVAKIEVVPTTGQLIIQRMIQLGHSKRRGDPGNISMEDLMDIARRVRHRSLAHKFAGTVKEVLGTCTAVKCYVQHQHPKFITAKIALGEIVVPEQ